MLTISRIPQARIGISEIALEPWQSCFCLEMLQKRLPPFCFKKLKKWSWTWAQNRIRIYKIPFWAQGRKDNQKKPRKHQNWLGSISQGWATNVVSLLKIQKRGAHISKVSLCFVVSFLLAGISDIAVLPACDLIFWEFPANIGDVFPTTETIKK